MKLETTFSMGVSILRRFELTLVSFSKVFRWQNSFDNEVEYMSRVSKRRMLVVVLLIV